MPMKRIPIFRPGTHTSAGGTSLEFSDADLHATIAAYDPAKHEAPIVVGHPKDNGPAFGWIRSLAYSEDGTMDAHADQVDPEFAELVRTGRYKQRSASFYTPQAASNPVPGVYYLRHVAFLGAAPPAVKGLPGVEFNDDDADVIEFTDDYAVASVFRRLREWMIGKWGEEDADRVVPGFLVEDLEDQARHRYDDDLNEAEPGFSDPPPSTEDTTMTPEEIQALQAENERLKTEAQQAQQQSSDFSEREQALAQRERELTRAALRTELAEHVTAGRVPPAQVAPLVEFMASLDDATATISFGEGDQAQTVSPRAYMRTFLAQLPKAIDYGEHSAGANDQPPVSEQALVDRTRAYKRRVKDETGREISFTEASALVREGADQR